jgi:hypothetical protein
MSTMSHHHHEEERRMTLAPTNRTRNIVFGTIICGLVVRQIYMFNSSVFTPQNAISIFTLAAANSTTTRPIFDATKSENTQAGQELHSLLSKDNAIIRNATAHKNDSHFSSTGILDLFPWERKSIFNFRPPKEVSPPEMESPESRLIQGTGDCYPPTGIERTCCLGSFSTGSGIVRHPYCAGGVEAFQRVRKRAMEFIHPNLDGSDCDVCQILDLSYQHNLTISFWGDSVQRQVWDGFQCELTRRNYRIVNETWQKEMQKLTDCQGMFCMIEIHSLQVTSPNWEYGRTAKINFFFQYRPKNTVEEIYSENFHHILEADTDVLFFNFGVHWPPGKRTAYQLKVGKVLETIQQYGKNISLLAFRETSAQHFNTTGGEWPQEKTRQSTGTCVPLQDDDNLVGWRDRLFWNMSRDRGYNLVVADPSKKEIADTPASDQQEIVIVPFLNFTRGLYDLHPKECTHYCSTPHIWYPLWRSLRLSMDWKFGG